MTDSPSVRPVAATGADPMLPNRRHWTWLGAGLLAAGCLSPPTDVSKRPTADAPPRRPPGLLSEGVVAQVLRSQNAERSRRGLPGLAGNATLNEAARRHADDMAASRRMSHRGSDGSSPFRRLADLGYAYQAAAENVAAGQPTPTAVVSAWMKSPGHRRNVLGPYEEAGAGYATDAAGTPYWCVTFGKPADARAASRAPGVGYASDNGF